MARNMGESDPVLEASLVEAKKKFDGLVEAVDRDLPHRVEAVGRGRRRLRAAHLKKEWWR